MKTPFPMYSGINWLVLQSAQVWYIVKSSDYSICKHTGSAGVLCVMGTVHAGGGFKGVLSL